MSINRVCISGNLTREPEMRSTANGTSVLGFGVAVNDRRRNSQTGEWEDVPNFVDCTLFGTRADGLAPYLHKGQKVAIEGKLRFSQWGEEGQKRSKLEVIVEEIEFMSQRQQQPRQQYQQQAYDPGYAQQAMQAAQYPQAQQVPAQPSQVTAPTPQPMGLYSEDIPF